MKVNKRYRNNSKKYFKKNFIKEKKLNNLLSSRGGIRL